MGNPESGAVPPDDGIYIEHAEDTAGDTRPQEVTDRPQVPIEKKPRLDKAHRAFLRAVIEHSVYVEPKELLNNPLGLKEANGDKSDEPELLVG